MTVVKAHFYAYTLLQAVFSAHTYMAWDYGWFNDDDMPHPFQSYGASFANWFIEEAITHNPYNISAWSRDSETQGDEMIFFAAKAFDAFLTDSAQRYGLTVDEVAIYAYTKWLAAVLEIFDHVMTSNLSSTDSYQHYRSENIYLRLSTILTTNLTYIENQSQYQRVINEVPELVNTLIDDWKHRLKISLM